MIDFLISGITGGQLNALVKNIMKQIGVSDPIEAIRLVNSGEWIICKPIRRWREQDGVVYFTLPPTDGTTGEEWITRLESKGFRIEDHVKSILRSKDFVPTNGVTNEIAVLRGMLFNDNNRATKDIRAKAGRRKFMTPNAEVACLIREMFTDKEIESMGFWWIVAMHKPIKDSVGDPRLISASRDDGSRRRLRAFSCKSGIEWNRLSGFAFVVAQA
jgi:hypothetical protein